MERDASGALWLQRGEQGGAGEGAPGEAPGDGRGDAALRDALRVEVYRAFYDESPMRVETHVRLNVSGLPREVTLTGLELPGATLVRVDSPLKVDISEAGARLYLKPGTHELCLKALLTAPAAALAVPSVAGGEVAPQEVWVWYAREGIRSVNLSGLDAIDPEQTTLPAALRDGTYTLLASPAQTLLIEELKRGVSEPPADRLSLQRDLWLDLDGEGYVSRDVLTGELNRSTRLNYTAAGLLGRAELTGAAAAPLLITRDPSSGLEGVEVRTRDLSLEAHTRALEGRADLLAVGWAHEVRDLTVRLSLPPGWRLLNAEGPTAAEGAWLQSWQTIDFFFILLVVVAMGRLIGWPTAALAGVMLTLYHGEDDAPRWAWVHLLAATALLRVLPRGLPRAATLAYGGAATLTLLVALLDAAHSDARLALHP
ncbi:MAG: hypothetical protein FJ138_11050, partial [Deltaproteobacteria bacterium]|nr:hypothetical protein [Deltaproteobacteria bacterium]